MRPRELACGTVVLMVLAVLTVLTVLGRQSGLVLRETMARSEQATAILNDFLSFRSDSYREVLNGSSGFMKSRELPFSFGR